MPFAPNMGLLLPDPTITLGPTYASENNDAFVLIDDHDHTLGKGLPIPSGALNINADLPFNNFNAITLRAARFTSQSAVLSTPSDINELYVVNGNLFYNNQLGQPVQITSGAAIDATSIGGIGGDYATSTALVFYTSADKTFTFWSNTNTPASIDSGPVTFRNDTLNSFGITFAPNASIAANYQITWPATLPSTSEGLSIDPSGNITYSGQASGFINMYGGTVAPGGWLMCDGTSYLRTAFPDLFAAIGTAYGAADGTHFNVPDFRGFFPRGTDNGAGRDPDASSRTGFTGGNTGDNVGSTQVSAFETHTHTIDPNNDDMQLLTTNAGGDGFTSGTGAVFIGRTGGPPNTGTVSSETRGINLYVNFLIKT